MLEQPVVHHRHVTGLHEPPRRPGGQGPLGRAALGLEPTGDDGERALAPRLGGRREERDVRAQPVVAIAVLERMADADERLAGAELERGGDTRWASPMRTSR